VRYEPQHRRHPTTPRWGSFVTPTYGLWFKILIAAALKWEIRDKLDQSNITEQVLFPRLEGLSAWLKRHDSPWN
jgi:hypothetical protein